MSGRGRVKVQGLWWWGEGVLSGWGGSLLGEGKSPVLLLSPDRHMMFVAPGSQIPLLSWLY